MILFLATAGDGHALLYSTLHKKILISLTGLVSAALIVACDSQTSSKPAITVPVQSYAQAKVLTGSITAKEGPISSGHLKVVDPTGKTVAELALQQTHTYRIEVPAGTQLPLVLQFSATQPKLDQALVAVVISKAVSKYDISPLTTLIAERAKGLGGYSYANMVLAADSTVGVPDANKTSTGFRGDPTTQYGGWH